MSDELDLARIAPRAEPPAAYATSSSSPASAAQAARRFEALVLDRLLEPATRPLFAKGRLFGAGSGGALPRQLFAAEVSRLAAERGGLGVARALARGERGSEGATAAHARAAHEGGSR